MQIQKSVLDALTAPTASTNSGASTASTTSSKSTLSSATDPLANENTFLQMMVAQLKNQDPLNPTDGAQFLGQLAQFSQLEQLMGIHQDLNTLSTPTPTGGTTAS